MTTGSAGTEQGALPTAAATEEPAQKAAQEPAQAPAREPSPEQAGPADENPPQTSHLPFLVVGIGASAGGMQALLRFFAQMPARNGMAFVIVMHLSPTHMSHAAEILQRETRMPVNEVTEAVPIEPDHVYVIPPGRGLWMEDGHLHLRDNPRVGGRSVAIDNFFRVLADVHRQQAVCVVLSGTGTDGAVGLQRIKEFGGVSLVQTPHDAEQDGMPRAAMATGMVDFVLPVTDMPERLMKLAANAGAIQLPADVAPELDAGAPYGPEAALEAEAALAEIMTMLRSRTKHDFRHYKRPTVLRRLERRMQVTQVPTLARYRDHLREHAEETPALLQDMLISVTNFFRDREAFEALERDAIPGLQARRSGETGLRVWVVGCATGEEAYSVAMLLQESRDRSGVSTDFQIFASDIDDRALAAARHGLYPGSIITDLAPSRLAGYFVREHEHYRVAKSLRDRVLFAHHNVLRDPPFSRVDLVCCRNLLIYLDRSAQAAVLETFRFALRPGGVLFLGSSESADVAGDAYTVVDKRNRIFRVAGHDPSPTLPVPRLPTAPRPSAGVFRPAGLAQRPAPYAELHQRAMLAAAAPSVLVDANHRMLHLSEGVVPYLQVQSGAMSHELLDNVHPALRLDLRTALFRARPVGPEEAPPVSVVTAFEGRRVRITVQPLQDDPQDGLNVLLVVFDDTVAAGELPLGGPPSAGAGDAAQASEAEVAAALQQMDQENRRLQQHLHEVVEHSETSNEELKSSNEELQAVNEELRSATEELETGREELQSINEELTTVNAQLAIKVDETGRVNDDLQNLINANDIATVFVDRGMRIKRYTPRATELFNLIPTDIGRSLLDITHQLDYAQLVKDANTAFHSLRLVEREVAATDGRFFVARMLPYRTGDDKIEGAILTFIDVTALRRSEREARAGAEQLRLAAESTRDFAILTIDEQARVTSWNLGATKLFGFEDHEIVGQPVDRIFTDEDRAAGLPQRELAQTRQHGRSEDERWHRRKDGSVFFASGVTTLLQNGRGYAKIARDLTGSKQAAMARERLLTNEQAGRRQAEASMEAKELFLAVMSHELKHPLNLIHVNAEVLTQLPEIRDLPTATRAAGIIQRTVAGQARIIDDLLDLSRARTGKLRLEPHPVDWTQVVRRIVEATRSNAEAQGVRLQFEPGAAAMVSMFDPVRAEQVVWNLLSNAVKFTPEGGSVYVALAIEGHAVRLTVTDSGRGIAPEFLPSVFEMFSQEGGPVRHQGGDGNNGLGIGLALVRELVQAQGGRVQARSEGLGRGAEMSVWVPVYEGPLEPADSAPAVSVLQGMEVLVVDDSADSAESFSLLLSTVGAKADFAIGGAEALDKLARHRYALLISDITMPGMSGHELIQTVRAQDFGRGLLALACSGYSRSQDERRALDAGFDALIAKPVSLQAVERAVALARR